MDEWLFISLAKTKADAPGVARKGESQADVERFALTKAQAAAALDFTNVEDKPAFRGATALVAAALATAVLLSAIDGGALDARTPKGEVVVAQLDAAAEPEAAVQLSQAQ